jgi:N6-adenosine-specific RNA methylase IME4
MSNSSIQGKNEIMTTFPIHPLAELFPPMQGGDFHNLVDDIRKNGLRDPIITLNDAVLDGRNRMRACIVAGVPCHYEPYTGADPLGFVISRNLHRRHLSESQRSMVAAKLAGGGHGGARRPNQAANLPLETELARLTQAEAGGRLNVSERSVRHGRATLDHGTPELIELVESDNLAVSTAADIACMPPPEQEEIVARGPAEIRKAARRIRAARKIRPAATAAPKRAILAPRGQGRHGVIVIDPAWDLQIEHDVRPEQVAFDYPPMNEAELAEFDVAGLAAEDCHLFCWTTQETLPTALRLVQVWGFSYAFTMVWHKNDGIQPVGLPQYNCEFIVYARRGTPKFGDTGAFKCNFYADREEHGGKPNVFYEEVRRVTDGARIDVFGGKMREGFERLDTEDTDFSSGDCTALTSEASLEIQPIPESA